MNRKTLCFLLSITLFAICGCQTGKWKMPTMPKMALWKDGGPRWFAKKDKELGPPPKYFNDETQIAKSDSELKLDLGKPSESPTTMPSLELKPDSGMQMAKASSSKPDSFVAPKVANADTQSAIRKPYEYSPPPSDSLKQAAQALSNSWDGLKNETRAAGSDFVASTSAKTDSVKQDVANEMNGAIQKAQGAMDTMTSPLTTPKTVPSENAIASNKTQELKSDFQPPASSNSFGGFAPLTNSQAASQPVAVAGQESQPISYPKTAQANNGFENLAAATAATSDLNKAEFAQTPALPASQSYANTGSPAFSSSGFQPSSTISAMPTRDSEYVLQSPPATNVVPAARTAGLPQELLNTSGAYTPGSTGRVSSSIY